MIIDSMKMKSKVLIGFNKHDRIWLIRITSFVVVISILLLIYGYYADYAYWEYKYEKDNTKIFSEERKVFKRFFEEQYEELIGRNQEILRTPFKNKPKHFLWPSTIIIKSGLSNQELVKELNQNKGNDASKLLNSWFDSMCDPGKDVNGK